LIFVFSGTSEGRELCERLAKNHVRLICFVATEYGSAVMNKDEYTDVRTGRLNRDEIVRLISEYNPEYVVDATHPHAQIVTEEIINACTEMDIQNRYIRVLRDINHDMSDEENTVINVSSCEEAIETLGEFYEGNILLTTGVKELHKFATENFKDRLIVRILPGTESLNETCRNGISSKAIIAMEGPFSEEMNSALIRQYNVSVLVTKNSGSRGGYSEKISACKACGIKAIVINKDGEENGISVDAAVKLITGNDSIRKNIFLVGCGICKEACLTKEAYDTIKNSEHLIGARRMVEFGRKINSKALYDEEYKADEVCRIIKDSQSTNIAVLFSGDTGLCSGAKSIYEILCSENDLNVKILPGISSVSFLSSKAGIQYSDYPFISMHGKDNDYLKLFHEQGGFISICSGVNDVKKIVSDLFNETSSGETEGTDVILGYNLGAQDEAVIHVENTNNLEKLKEGLYVIAVIMKEQ